MQQRFWILPQGDEVCALEEELSLDARMKEADVRAGQVGDVAGEGSSVEAATPPKTRRRTASSGGDRGGM